ncbi:MAG TPA: hypothetical protein VF610_05910 [Segetibacter sp.]|jgi:hypothetical protein
MTHFQTSDSITAIEPDENPGTPITEPELEPEKIPHEDPGIQPGKFPEKDDDDDDDDDDDPYHGIEIGDDPDEERKKVTIMTYSLR